MLGAVLFGWAGTLMQFEWDDELLAAGHRAGLAALGRGDEAPAFTARFERETLPALRAERLDYGAVLRDLLGPLGDDELDRFLDAEHDAWRPARAIVGSAHALLESLRARGVRLAVVANAWPEPPRLVRREIADLGVAERVDAVVVPADAACALADLGVDPLDALVVRDRLDELAVAAASGISTMQAMWFRADDAAGEFEPDYVAFTPADVLTVALRLLN